jgi:selenophosphate synthetase-related protein
LHESLKLLQVFKLDKTFFKVGLVINPTQIYELIVNTALVVVVFMALVEVQDFTPMGAIPNSKMQSLSKTDSEEDELYLIEA